MKYASIFDFDDTLFCTTHVTDGYNQEVRYIELSHLVASILTYAKKRGVVFIVTNAEMAWVEQAVNNLTKDAIQAFQGVNLYSTVNTGISATVSFDRRKTVAFLRLAPVIRGSPQHIICVGDSVYDRHASIALRDVKLSRGEKVFVKSLKLLDQPNCSLLIDQLRLFYNSIDDWYDFNGQMDCFVEESARAISTYA